MMPQQQHASQAGQLTNAEVLVQAVMTHTTLLITLFSAKAARTWTWGHAWTWGQGITFNAWLLYLPAFASTKLCFLVTKVE